MNTKPQKEFDPSGLMEALSMYSKERKTIRRILCAYLRKHRHVFRNDGWILRKITGGWLGDLTDYRLISYCKKVRRSFEE